MLPPPGEGEEIKTKQHVNTIVGHTASGNSSFPLALSQTAATGGAVGSVCFTLGKQTAEKTPRPVCTHS